MNRECKVYTHAVSRSASMYLYGSQTLRTATWVSETDTAMCAVIVQDFDSAAHVAITTHKAGQAAG